MIVQLKTLPVAPEDHPVADAISTLASLVPAQIDQTRRQIKQLVSSPAAQVALHATTGALGGAGALASTAVAELVMSAVENKVYEITAPTIEDSSTREAIMAASRQEVRLKAEGVDLQTAPEAGSSWAADPEIAHAREDAPAALRSTGQQVGSILEDTFGPKISRLREQYRLANELNRPILSGSTSRLKR